MNAFITDDGFILLQSSGQRWDRPEMNTYNLARFYIFDNKLNFVGTSKAGNAHYHGTSSVDQSRNVLMFAEYYPNSRITYNYGETLERFSNNIFKSIDNGQSWKSVFIVSPENARHFHTLQADPFIKGHWYATTGDRNNESNFYLSTDDGDSWKSVIDPNLDISVHPSTKHELKKVYRLTDMIITKDLFIWGTDDILGYLSGINDRPIPVGSRLYCAEKKFPIKPIDIGYIGCPVRSIVDVEQGYLIFTEAKYKEFGFEPSLFFLRKKKGQVPSSLHFLKKFPNKSEALTSFTSSRASRATVDGTFFTFRDGPVLLDSQDARFLRWKITFS